MSELTGNTSQAEAIKVTIEAMLAEMVNTSIPGIVEKYDHTTAKATVTPAVKKVFLDGTVLEPKPIENVNVQFPRGGDYIHHFPINKGDYVLLVFCQRSIDNWKTGGGIKVPGARRKFSSSDAIAIPGVFPFSEPTGVSNNTDIVFKTGNGSIVIEQSGRVNINDGNLTIEP